MQPIKLEIVTPPGAEPFDAAVLATWIGCAATDPLLPGLIQGAREVCERTLGVALIDQTWKQWFDVVRVPDDWWDGIKEGPTTNVHRLPSAFKIGRWPVQSITHAKFYANDDSVTIADSASYFLSKTSRPPLIALRPGYTWPSIDFRVVDSVEVQFVAGYGAAGTDVPAALINGMKAYAAYQYEHRGACDVDEALKMSGAMSYWKPYTVMKT